MQKGRLPSWLIFALLYLPFVYSFGVLYAEIDNADLPSFYAAAHVVFGLHRSPYVPSALRKLRGGLVWPFLYPPTSLLAFFPMSRFSYEHVRVAMLCINHVALLVLLFGLCRRHPALRGPPNELRTALFVAFVLGFTPVVVTLNHGQTNIVTALALLLFWHFASEGRAWAAGTFLSVAILLKTPFVLVLLVPLLLGKRGLVLKTLAVSAGFVLLTWLALPGSLWVDWLHIVPTVGYGETPAGLFSPAADWNQSFNGFFSRLIPTAAGGHVGTYLASLLAIAASAFAVRRARAIQDERDAFRVGLTIVMPLIYLVAPLSWEHHLVYLLPTVAVQLSHACFGDFPYEPRLPALIVPAAVLLALPFGLLYKFFGVLALWAAGMVSALRPVTSPQLMAGGARSEPGGIGYP
jgi:alpha-1,2-mannosyltransferase